MEPRFTWVYPDRAPLDEGFVAAVAAHGGSARLARVMAARGIGPGEVDRFFGPARDSLHEPALLPDVEVAVERIGRANDSGEGVLVVGDFDADGLTGLAIMVRALRRVGIDAAWHVPSRLDDGHGLSPRAVELARAAGRGLIITVDMGSSSGAEIAAAGLAGIDVIVTDHHRVRPEPPPAIAVVNPHRPDSVYPDARLTGSGVALKVAALLLGRLAGIPVEETTAGFADLATIGTVADVAPVLGENRGIARLGLDRIRRDPRPGIAALLAAAGVAPGDATLETIGFALAPRLNAAGRVGDADVAAALLLTDDAAEAAVHATALDAATWCAGTSRVPPSTRPEPSWRRRAARMAARSSCAGPWPVGSSASSRDGPRRTPGCPPWSRRRWERTSGPPAVRRPGTTSRLRSRAARTSLSATAATAARRASRSRSATGTRSLSACAASWPPPVRRTCVPGSPWTSPCRHGRWTMRSFATSTRSARQVRGTPTRS